MFNQWSGSKFSQTDIVHEAHTVNWILQSNFKCLQNVYWCIYLRIIRGHRQTPKDVTIKMRKFCVLLSLSASNSDSSMSSENVEKAVVPALPLPRLLWKDSLKQKQKNDDVCCRFFAISTRAFDISFLFFLEKKFHFQITIPTCIIRMVLYCEISVYYLNEIEAQFIRSRGNFCSYFVYI